MTSLRTHSRTVATSSSASSGSVAMGVIQAQTARRRQRTRVSLNREGGTPVTLPHGGTTPLTRRSLMGLVVLLLILALLFGGAGLFIEGLKWLLIIALVLFVASFFTVYRGRSTV